MSDKRYICQLDLDQDDTIIEHPLSVRVYDSATNEPIPIRKDRVDAEFRSEISLKGDDPTRFFADVVGPTLLRIDYTWWVDDKRRQFEELVDVPAPPEAS